MHGAKAFKGSRPARVQAFTGSEAQGLAPLKHFPEYNIPRAYLGAREADEKLTEKHSHLCGAGIREGAEEVHGRT